MIRYAHPPTASRSLATALWKARSLAAFFTSIMLSRDACCGTSDAPCFQRVISLFSLCYLLLEKSSKSLIPLSDCPFVLNRLPVFLENLPVSGKKQRWNEQLSFCRRQIADRFGRVKASASRPRATRGYRLDPAKTISTVRSALA
jgi:hypothetical protein